MLPSWSVAASVCTFRTKFSSHRSSVASCTSTCIRPRLDSNAAVFHAEVMPQEKEQRAAQKAKLASKSKLSFLGEEEEEEDGGGKDGQMGAAFDGQQTAESAIIPKATQQVAKLGGACHGIKALDLPFVGM